MAALLLLFFMLAIFSISPLPAQSISNLLSQQQWLLGFKAGITLDPKNSLSNWNSHIPLCNWTGITCTHSLVALNLSSMSLEGTISPLLGNISSLQSLNLSNNALHGQIPPQLSQLCRLQILSLYSNQLDGNIPPELSLLRRLKYLHLGVNNLTGTIPSSLGNSSSLVELYLEENDLDGPIPPVLGTLNQLQVLCLHRNHLSGAIPPSLGNLSDLNVLKIYLNHLHGTIPPELGLLALLKTLYLGGNYLAGNIPSSLGNLSALTDTVIGLNNLDGPIPVELGRLTQLQQLHLYSNKLSGTIPSSLTNLSRLIVFSLIENQLSGHIPWELCTKLPNLQYLMVGRNQLSGNIPSSIRNCSNLRVLALDMNHMSGVVPMQLGHLKFLRQVFLESNQLVGNSSSTMTFLTSLINCSNLERMTVSDNYLSGVLPTSVGQFSSKLSILGLSYNMISGIIPPHIANLTNLTNLDLSNNFFSGNIPSGFKRFHKLERLYLQGNGLEGGIPNEIGQMHSLGLLSLSHNRLSGKIPDSLCSLPQLRRLYLHHNYLSGGIPASLEGCQNLELLDLSYNKLKGRIPREVLASLSNLQFYLNLSGNFLHGSLPLEVSKIVMAQEIDISSNQLDGVIPSALGGCIALERLNLSHNAFEGPIPDTLTKLQNLQEIDLSFNNLSGQIPEKWLFPNITVITLFMGNPGLCGPQNYSLPTCRKQRQGNHTLRKKIVFSVVGIISFIVCSLILGMLWRQKFSRQLLRPSNSAFPRVRYPKFSYQDLVTATNGFDQENFLGVGSFGSVYKGILRDGRVVAIKALNFQNEEAHKSFSTECKVLGRIRHRNLIRIISAFSYPGLIGLVLEFASNGSLEKHLHPDRNEEDCCELGLSECLNIAVDVAHGMEYLHYDCSMQVVHCDLKPSNVVLDSNMTAVVTDFGISRLTTAPNSTDSPNTSTFVLKGSIGYIAPEYGLGGSVSTKGDVYSYGILILEMVTRKRPSDDMFVGDMNLRKWVRSAFPERIVDIVDGRLLRDVNADMERNRCLLSFIEVGLLCTRESSTERPSMRDVVMALESMIASFTGSAAALNLTSTISDLLRNTNLNPTATSASDSQSSTV